MTATIVDMTDVIRELDAIAAVDRYLRDLRDARLEAEFVVVAADSGARRGISYEAWREAGVAAAVLKRAGIRR